MASDAACIDSAAGSVGPFTQFHSGGGADESGQLPVDADSKEGVFVQILMRQSQTVVRGCISSTSVRVSRRHVPVRTNGWFL